MLFRLFTPGTPASDPYTCLMPDNRAADWHASAGVMTGITQFPENSVWSTGLAVIQPASRYPFRAAVVDKISP